tara:strand:+ start:134 stop:388 length:255 start_codon:yes stop_codon:yes gene_type:complete
MKDFNDFIEYRKPLQRVMDSLNESDGIMLESMFYEFAKQQITKAKNLPIADVSQAKRPVCPDCFDRGELRNDKEEIIGTCPCHY